MVKSSFQRRLPDKTSFQVVHHYQLCGDEKQSKAERKREEKRTKRMEKKYRRRKKKRANQPREWRRNTGGARKNEPVAKLNKCRRLFSEEDPPRLQSTGGQLSRAPKHDGVGDEDFVLHRARRMVWLERRRRMEREEARVWLEARRKRKEEEEAKKDLAALGEKDEKGYPGIETDEKS
nr:MAG: hypothetical protein [Sesarmops intermedium nimavirus]